MRKRVSELKLLIQQGQGRDGKLKDKGVVCFGLFSFCDSWGI